MSENGGSPEEKQEEQQLPYPGEDPTIFNSIVGMGVTISEQAAQVLISICRQLTIHDAASKVNVGKAQMELELALAKLHPPEKAIVIPRAARRRAQKAGMAS